MSDATNTTISIIQKLIQSTISGEIFNDENFDSIVSPIKVDMKVKAEAKREQQEKTATPDGFDDEYMIYDFIDGKRIYKEYTHDTPHQLLEFSRDNGCRNSLHPTQKPVALIEYLIKTYTNEGETVLDFTAGSFTTAVACENTNRKWICIEKDEKYYNIGINRINNI